MNPLENFRPRCTAEEAAQVGKYLPCDLVLFNVYESGYRNAGKEQPQRWKQFCGLQTVYAFGFLSGCRAIRAGKKRGASR